jgi:crossover junction endodeoxyribonuclease RuvC
MIILGVDPGTIYSGYGVISIKEGKCAVLEHGIIQLKAVAGIPEKLEIIYQKISSLIKLHKPESVVIETAFYGKNIQSALKIGLARGAAILAARHHHKEIFEYAPREIKKSVTGNGAASKEQVMGMVQTTLGLTKPLKYFDESDALAAALCHSYRCKSAPKRTGSWKSFVEQHPERILH